MVGQGLARPLWTGALFLAVVALLDDIRGVPIGPRFLAHFLAAASFAWLTLAGVVPWPLIVLVTIGIVWVTNLYNFMDGSDGLAGGMAFYGFGAYAVGAWLAGAPEIAAACLCVSAGSAGFLVFNFAPAKTFMGDVGSIPLGFLAASIGVLGWIRALWPAWFPLLVFSPFLVDATVTVLARLSRKEKIWQAHRSHYYQRVVLMGWSHAKVALAEYALMLGVALSAVALLHLPLPSQLASLVAWTVLYAALIVVIDTRWRRFQASQKG
jgi:UDP-N-acetylmuramyl pentapeptide phosphotransferase/UDP-N-acetylglucosamine-1-phosphate transferase